MSKVWKADGPEQKYLEKLFRDKTVKPDMKPSAVQKAYPIFHGFSAMVFRKHWGATKQMYDERCKTLYNRIVYIFVSKRLIFIVDSPAVLDREREQSSYLNSFFIPEVDGLVEQSQESPEKKAKFTGSEVQKESPIPAQFLNGPVLPCVYTDPVSKQEKCLVVVLLFSGVTKITFDVIESNDGPEPTLKIKYEWPTQMFDTNSMFKRDSEEEMFVNKLHPKVLAVENALKKIRANMEDAPVGLIEVKLPVAIQMDPEAWTQQFNKKKDGNIIVIFEFLCIRNEYTIKKTEKTLNFV